LSPVARGPALILIAADIDVKRLVEAGFEPQHVRVTVAADADQTLAIARDAQPDLIVVRVDTGGITGIAIARHLKCDAATASIPVLAVMAQSCPDDLRHRAECAPFDALLLQPITATTLAQVGGLVMERAALVRQRGAKRRTTATAASPLAKPSIHHPLPPVQPAVNSAAARLPAPVAPRCRYCGNNADTQLLRSTEASFRYRCGVCHGQWREVRPRVVSQDGERRVLLREG
jgi:CheY-like chemotaxis protein